MKSGPRLEWSPGLFLVPYLVSLGLNIPSTMVRIRVRIRVRVRV